MEEVGVIVMHTDIVLMGIIEVLEEDEVGIREGEK